MQQQIFIYVELGAPNASHYSHDSIWLHLRIGTRENALIFILVPLKKLIFLLLHVGAE